MEENRGVYRILVGKPEGKRLLGKPNWEGNNKIDLQEVGCEDMERIDVSQDKER